MCREATILQIDFFLFFFYYLWAFVYFDYQFIYHLLLLEHFRSREEFCANAGVRAFVDVGAIDNPAAIRSPDLYD